MKSQTTSIGASSMLPLSSKQTISGNGQEVNPGDLRSGLVKVATEF